MAENVQMSPTSENGLLCRIRASLLSVASAKPRAFTAASHIQVLFGHSSFAEAYTVHDKSNLLVYSTYSKSVFGKRHRDTIIRIYNCFFYVH